jgi:hypothetical protein
MSVNKIGASRRAIVATYKAVLVMRRLLLGVIRAWHHTVDARAFLYQAAKCQRGSPRLRNRVD